LGAIGGAIGLRQKGKDPAYDPYGQVVEKALLAAEPQAMLEAFFEEYTLEKEFSAYKEFIFEKLKDKNFCKDFIEVVNLSLFNPNLASHQQWSVRNCFIFSESSGLVPITQSALDLVIELRDAIGEDAFYNLVDAEDEVNWPEEIKEIQKFLKSQGLKIQDFGLLDNLEAYFPADAALMKVFSDFGVIVV